MFIQPMLLKTSDKAFNHSDYIFEPKMDGFRGILSQKDGKATLFTRHKNIISERFPELLKVPVSGDVILDGEVICYDPETQKVDFEKVMNRFSTKSIPKVKQKCISMPCSFVAFDILFYKGEDLRQLPLVERKSILDDVLKENNHFHNIRYVEGKGRSFFSSICIANLEGVCAKLKSSPYESRRSKHWLKIINWQHEEVFITGYLKNQYGWLAAMKTKNRLKPIGIIEHGPSPTERQAFYKVAQSLITDEDSNTVYLEPPFVQK
jgi:DNA ligase-1